MAIDLGKTSKKRGKQMEKFYYLQFKEIIEQTPLEEFDGEIIKLMFHAYSKGITLNLPKHKQDEASLMFSGVWARLEKEMYNFDNSYTFKFDA